MERGPTRVVDDKATQLELERELDRLRHADPLGALQLPPGSPATVIRERFLELTKEYHPNRFARSAAPLPQLANEVYLLIKTAYARAMEADGRTATETETPTGSMPRLETGSMRRLDTGAMPRLDSGSVPRLEIEAEIARRRRTRTNPTLRGSEKNPVLVAPGAPAGSRPSGTDPAAAGLPVRTPTPRPGPAPAGAPLSTNAVTQPVSITGAMPALSPDEVVDRVRKREEERRERFHAAVADLRAGRLGAARDSLRTLMVDAPSDPQLRTFFHYALARDHHAGGRLAEARAEYQRALRWDASFEPARTSLALLDDHTAPREAPLQEVTGGLLSRWFRK